MISPLVTLPKGYIVLDTTGSFSNKNLGKIVKILEKAEENNIVFSSGLIRGLISLDETSFKVYEDIILEYLEPMKGRFFRSSFASGEDLEDEAFTVDDFINQLNHYFISYGLGEFDSNVFEEDSKRKIQISNVPEREVKQNLNESFRIIDVKSKEEFINDVKCIMGSPIVWGAQQREILAEAHNNNLLMALLGTDIKVKENLFSIVEIIGKENAKSLDVFKTATDVLRYAYFVSNLDYRRLPKGVKFSLKTSDKKLIMGALDRISSKSLSNTFGDMKPYKNQWVALSRNLFPGSKKFSKFSKAQTVFNHLRNDKKIKTFSSRTEDLITENNMVELTRHLSKKPGELLRRLDMIIRNSNKNDIEEIADIIKNTTLNPKLILQVRKYLEYRTEHALEERIFNIKGKPISILDKPLKKLKTKQTLKITNALRDVLKEHLKGKDLFGLNVQKMYLDPKLKKYIVPTEMRNNSKSEGKVFTPGTRLPLGDEVKFVRLFTAWATKNGDKGLIDIDLGGAFIKEVGDKLKMIPISFYNQTESFAVHSGDFTICKEYKTEKDSITAEYIDVDIEKAREAGFRYAITAELIFARAKDYDDMQAWSGVQLLSELRTEKSKEVNLSDVLFKVKLQGAYQSHCALAIDFEANEIVILDQYSEERAGITVNSMAGKMNAYKKLFFNAQEFQENMYDFLDMYCEVNEVEKVYGIDEADIICSYNDYKGLNANQVMFNVSDNLEKVIGLLN